MRIEIWDNDEGSILYKGELPKGTDPVSPTIIRYKQFEFKLIVTDETEEIYTGPFDKGD